MDCKAIGQIALKLHGLQVDCKNCVPRRGIDQNSNPTHFRTFQNQSCKSGPISSRLHDPGIINKIRPISVRNAGIEPNQLHFAILAPFACTCQSSRILHQRTTMHGACCNPFSCQDTTNTRSCQVSFLLHNPIAFKKSWHVPAIKAEEMVEG